MWLNTLLFVAGVWLCQQLPVLPALYWFGLVPFFVSILVLPIWQHTLRYGFLAFLLGFSWSVLHAHVSLSDQLDPSLVKKELRVTGTVEGLPTKRFGNWQFGFRIDTAQLDGKEVELPAKVRLTWYRSRAQVNAGDQWQLSVKLKPPAGRLNPGLFNRETWMYANGYGASGYVLDRPQNLKSATWPLTESVHVLRGKVKDRLAEQTQTLPYSQASAVLLALTIGDKTAISKDLWELFRVTGINHLVAISGLHISLIAMLAYYLAGTGWRLSAWLCGTIEAQRVQAVAALTSASLYAAMAGFSLPTQRALIMLIVIMTARILYIHVQNHRQLVIALYAVLLWDPMAVISAGFWLSFMAVGAILLAISGFRKRWKIISVFSVQWSIFLVLAPVLLIYFGKLSLLSPLVNLILVPLFGVFFVPAGLLVAALAFLESQWALDVVVFYLSLLQGVLDYLAVFTQYPGLLVSTERPDGVVLLLVIAAIVLWFAPLRRISQPASMALLSFSLSVPAPGHDDKTVEVTMLDVGQGLSVFLRTGDKTLLYDLGPRYPGGASATRSIVVPFLQDQGIDRLDKVIVSHADSDHAGDLQALLNEVLVGVVYSGERLKTHRSIEGCSQDQSWSWNGVKFEFVNEKKFSSTGNNASCVLSVLVGERRILFTGDIESSVEQQLIKRSAKQMRADYVFVPHHGSRSSSTLDFVKAVSPRVVLNSSGYLNRYNFPVDEVEKRWRLNNAGFYDTAQLGAVTFVLNQHGELVEIEGFRDKSLKYWYWPR